MDRVPATKWEEVMEVIGTIASDYTDHLDDFPHQGMEAFAKTANQAIMESTTSEEMYTNLSSLYVYAFLAGREHALRGYTSPVRKNTTTSIHIEIPDDFRPPLKD